MKNSVAWLILLLFAVAAFSLATVLQPRAANWSQRGQDSVLKVMLGDGRRLFANHFFTKADIYFHSGYYPSIFDGRQTHKESHMSGHDEGHEDEEHEKEADFLGKPRDWVEAFGRHFMITEHTHLENGKEREILPWLKLSAELDPQLVDTYTVAAFWLANQLHKTKEAKEFLREGLRANPDSYEILFSLGKIYHENEHDVVRARNVWELGIRRWHERQDGAREPDNLALEQILVHLGRMEDDEGDFKRALELLEQAQKISPVPKNLQSQIDELRAKISGAPASTSRQTNGPSVSLKTD